MQASGLEPVHRLALATRPAYFDVRVLVLAQSEVQAQIALREVAAATSHFAVLCPARALDADASADRATVRLRPLQFEQDPTSACRRLCIQQGRCGILAVNEDFQLPVIVDVCGGHAPSRPRRQNAGPGGCRDIPEALAIDVAVEDSGLAVPEVGVH